METKGEMREKLILVDGNGLAYRAFYALPPLKTSRGEPMNAVYGFTNMLYQIIEDEKPDYMGVAFDKSRPTARLDQFAEYKAHRQRMPEELEIQFAFIEEVVSALKIPIFWTEGYEADDCIATLATAAREKGVFTRIYSGDLDMLQLVTPETQVVTTRRGISDLVVYDEEQVRKRFSINPPQLVDYKALAGDSSDHIPGIPGIGEASASKLLNQFESLEAMFGNPDGIPSRWRKQILENQEQAYLSKRLASLEKHLPLEYTWEDLRVKEPEREDLKQLFLRLEFKTMLKRLGFKEEEMEEIQDIIVEIVGKDEDLDYMLGKLGGSSGSFSIMWMAENNELISIAIGEGRTNGYYFPFVMPEGVSISSTFGISTFSRDRVLHELKPHLENPSVTKYIYDLKGSIPYLKRGEYFTGRNFADMMIAGYLLEPDNAPRSLEAVLNRYADFKAKSLDEIVNPKKTRKKISIVEVPLQDLSLFTAGRAVRINRLGPEMQKRLKKEEMLDYFKEIEMPLTSVIAAMETRGIKIDTAALEDETNGLVGRMQEAANEIYALAGREFNINSTKQLGTVLFEELKIKGGESTESGFKTSAEVLEKLVDEHPIIEKILKYRDMARIKSNLLDSIKNQIVPTTGRLHLSFAQNLSIAGRIISTMPNLQQIPESTKRIFVPTDQEKAFIGFDFTQLEMRILAHLSGDSKMKQVFEANGDIHRHAASVIFGVTEDEVTEQMRKTAKEINFSLINGSSAHAISRELGIDKASVKDYLAKHAEYFSEAVTYLEKLVETARETGYVKTILGRKRSLANIDSRNKNMRSSAEKGAISFAVTGSAADIIKKTLVDVFEGVARTHRDMHLMLQVREELLIETRKRRVEKYSNDLRNLMEHVVQLSVPIAIKVSEGINWKEMNSKIPATV
ncbi:MAG: DNA polymerase I [Firmicutes bacterium]|nr:DNA polymerase I [Bacillota bacterium]